MIDLHCHLLPGIDDGPTTVEDALQLCRMAVACGTTHAITTPHIHPGRWENTRRSIGEAVSDLRRLLASNNVPLHLGLAGEVRLSEEVMQQVLDGEIPYYGEIGGYQLMLLEFPHGHIIPGSEKLVRWLMERGVRPLIAHPERNKQVMKQVVLLQPFIEAGCWMQLTAGSITGNFGPQAQAVARQLLDDNAVAVVASDAHNVGARTPHLGPAFEYISDCYGEQRARQLFIETPATITADQFRNSGEFTSIASAV